MRHQLQQNRSDFAPWQSQWCRLGMALALLLLLHGGGQLVSATAAGDKAKGDSSASADADADEDGDDDMEGKTQLEKVREIVLWNEHNGHNQDNGAKNCNVTLSLEGETVWERNDVEVPWEADRSKFRVIEVPSVKADKIRVEITSWHKKGGGLSEIEVLDKTGRNMAFGGKVTTSNQNSAGNQLGGAALNDENYYSPSAEIGYWLLPKKETGWAEIELQPLPIESHGKERKAVKKGKKQLSRTPMSAEMLVACDGEFEIYINGEHVLSGHGERVFTRHVAIANADAVAARCSGTGNKGGLCVLFRFPTKHFLSTAVGWKSFTPGNPDKWWDPERATGGAVAGGGSAIASKLMEDETGLKIPSIWGKGQDVYLGMQADTSVKKVKPKMPVRRR